MNKEATLLCDPEWYEIKSKLHRSPNRNRLIGLYGYYDDLGDYFESEKGVGFFAADEVGLSPLRYSEDEGALMVEIAPLDSRLQKKLGFPARIEPMLAAWHAISITNEGNVADYTGINWIEPWRYVRANADGGILLPSKRGIEADVSYEELVLREH